MQQIGNGRKKPASDGYPSKVRDVSEGINDLMVSSELIVAAVSQPDAQHLSALVASIPPVQEDAIFAEVDAAEATSHELPRLAELFDAAILLTDLTTLEGKDTPEAVRQLSRRALAPDVEQADGLHTAAVCVYGDLAFAAREVLGDDSPVELACVAGAFPAGRAHIDVKLADVRYALSNGATEIDMVIDRGAFNDGDFAKVYDDVFRIVREAHQASARVKVILENGELAGGLTGVSQASWLALAAGADMIKTSTGKIPSAATLPDVAVMLHAAHDFEQLTGTPVGVKAAGGIRTALDAIRYLSLVENIVGTGWLVPSRFRFGASSVLTDLVRARGAIRLGTDPFAAPSGATGSY